MHLQVLLTEAEVEIVNRILANYEHDATLILDEAGGMSTTEMGSMKHLRNMFSDAEPGIISGTSNCIVDLAKGCLARANDIESFTLDREYLTTLCSSGPLDDVPNLAAPIEFVLSKNPINQPMDWLVHGAIREIPWYGWVIRPSSYFPGKGWNDDDLNIIVALDRREVKRIVGVEKDLARVLAALADLTWFFGGDWCIFSYLSGFINSCVSKKIKRADYVSDIHDRLAPATIFTKKHDLVKSRSAIELLPPSSSVEYIQDCHPLFDAIVASRKLFYSSIEDLIEMEQATQMRLTSRWQ